MGPLTKTIVNVLCSRKLYSCGSKSTTTTIQCDIHGDCRRLVLDHNERKEKEEKKKLRFFLFVGSTKSKLFISLILPHAEGSFTGYRNRYQHLAKHLD